MPLVLFFMCILSAFGYIISIHNSHSATCRRTFYLYDEKTRNNIHTFRTDAFKNANVLCWILLFFPFCSFLFNLACSYSFIILGERERENLLLFVFIEKIHMCRMLNAGAVWFCSFIGNQPNIIHVRVSFIFPRVLVSKSNCVHIVHTKTIRKSGYFHKTPKKEDFLWISIRHYLTGFSHYHVSWIFAADIFQMGTLLVARFFSLHLLCTNPQKIH